MQCEHTVHSTMLTLNLESESESEPEIRFRQVTVDVSGIVLGTAEAFCVHSTAIAVLFH